MKKYFLIVFLILGITSLHAYSYDVKNEADKDIHVCVRVTRQHQCRTIVAKGQDVFRWTGGDAGLTLVSITASDAAPTLGANPTGRPYGNQQTQVGGLTGDRAFEIISQPTTANPGALHIREMW